LELTPTAAAPVSDPGLDEAVTRVSDLVTIIDDLVSALDDEARCARRADSAGLADAASRKEDATRRYEAFTSALPASPFARLPDAALASVLGAQASLRAALAANQRDLRATVAAVSIILDQINARTAVATSGYGPAGQQLGYQKSMLPSTLERSA
jgi:hypothetical protein